MKQKYLQLKVSVDILILVILLTLNQVINKMCNIAII